MIEVLYRDGRSERLWSGYGLVSDGVELHIGIALGAVCRRNMSDVEEIRRVD